MRFLISRRWALFALVVGVLAAGTIALGNWQFDRRAEREQSNAWISENLERSPAPVTDVMDVDEPLPEEREWMPVRATGVYDDSATVVVRYQTRDGEPGVDVVTPLVTDGGAALIVDRGWLSTPNTGTLPTDLPAPPEGRVQVTGWARADATGRGIEVENGSTRAISSAEIGQLLDRPVYAGFVDLASEAPAPAEPLQRTELPDLGGGPHLFYGIQWWFFGALALFGFGYLAWDERRRHLKARAGDPADHAPATHP